MVKMFDKSFLLVLCLTNVESMYYYCLFSYTKFLFDRYMDVNIKASPQYKKYNDILPAYLHNRPKEVIEHCRQRFVREEEVAGTIVKGEGMYTPEFHRQPYHLRCFSG